MIGADINVLIPKISERKLYIKWEDYKAILQQYRIGAGIHSKLLIQKSRLSYL